MKILVIYDSVSATKTTGKVADSVVAGIKEKGLQVDSYFVDDASKVNIKDYDCLVVGAPTMAWRPSKRMKEFLAGLKKEYAGKKATSFDTQMRSAVSGNATKHMEKSLMTSGFSIVTPSLIAYVESENKQYHLRDGEMEKIKVWSHDLAKALMK